MSKGATGIQEEVGAYILKDNKFFLCLLAERVLLESREGYTFTHLHLSL